MKKIHFIFAALLACFVLLSGCKKEEYVVTFNPNGGKGAIVTQTFTVKVSQPLMANSFTHNGFTFTGWSSRPDGTGISYKDQEVVKISENLVLYAQWASATGNFTVTFNANGGEGNMKPQTFTAGEPQTLSANRFIYEGYSFSGWCTSPNGMGEKFDNQQTVSITSNTTLYAQWKRNLQTFFVIFNANGGEGTMEPQAFVGDIVQELDTNKFEREGYIFKHWNTDSLGKGKDYSENEAIRLFSNMKLYAQWKEK